MMEVASAVRVPSPEPPRKRDRSPSNTGPSKRLRGGYNNQPDEFEPPPAPQREKDYDARFAMLQEAMNATRKPPVDDSKTRAGGAYIPPARLRAMQAAITDKTSPEFQRMAWEALKKSIQGLINKANVANIKMIVPELFGENLIRGRGLFCRSIMKAQAASLPFTPIYAAMVAIVNTKIPVLGELLVKRLIVQFRKAFKRNDKKVTQSAVTFLAHLVNQQVVHEILVAQILLLLLHKPTDDSVEIAVGLTREVGQFMEEMNGAISNAIYDQFRNILHEADIDKRTQYMIEVLFQVRKDRYKDNPAVKEELDLVEEEDQITHRPGLDDQIEVEDGLNVFKFDSEYEEHEEAYKKLRSEILGEVDGSDEEDEYTDESSEDEEQKEERELEVRDQSNAELVHLRRNIYLTFKNSVGFEECCHKLMRINLPAGHESVLPSMVIETAYQERTYEKFYGLVGERLCKLNRMWTDLFESAFANQYDTIHRRESNQIRIIAQFFSHLLATDALGWHVLSVIRINEDDTTSSSRIFIKELFLDLSQAIGVKKLVERLKEDALQPSLDGIFPIDERRNTTFSINFFTAIGMGVLTEGMREWLKNNAPKPPPLPEPESESDSESVSSYSSYSSHASHTRSPFRSRSRSRSPPRRRLPSRSPTPRRKRYDSESPSRSPSPPRRRRYSSSRSPSPLPRTRRRDTSVSPSRSPPPRRRPRSYTRSPSPPPRRNRYRDSESRSRSPPPPRRRRNSSSVSRSPPPRRRRRSDS